MGCFDDIVVWCFFSPYNSSEWDTTERGEGRGGGAPCSIDPAARSADDRSASTSAEEVVSVEYSRPAASSGVTAEVEEEEELAAELLGEAGEGEEEHCQALGEFFSLTALGFQLASDVSAIRRGEPSALQCVTMPVVKALGKCKTRPERQQIVDALRGTGGGAALGRERLCPLVEAAGGRPLPPHPSLPTSPAPSFTRLTERSALLPARGFRRAWRWRLGWWRRRGDESRRRRSCRTPTTRSC